MVDRDTLDFQVSMCGMNANRRAASISDGQGYISQGKLRTDETRCASRLQIRLLHLLLRKDPRDGSSASAVGGYAPAARPPSVEF